MFEEQVVGDTPRLVERRVDDLIDWMVDADFRQWQSVTSSLADRRRERDGRPPGDDVGNFSSDRSRLIDSVGREAQRVVETYDRTRESAALAEGARGAVAAAAAAGAGALGLGALVTAVATTAAADVTGLLMASAVAALGFFILPAKRRQGKAEMRGKITAMRDRLASALRSQFEEEIRRSAGRIRESVGPYSRFVRAEGQKLDESAVAFRGSLDALDRVRAELERALPAGAPALPGLGATSFSLVSLVCSTMLQPRPNDYRSVWFHYSRESFKTARESRIAEGPRESDRFCASET